MRFAPNSTGRGKEINITSLIDVMFLLVIFVLVAAKFEKDGGIAVNLPNGASKEVAREEVQVLSLTKDGKVFLQKREISFDTLEAEIKKMRTEQKDPVVVINADRDVPYGLVAKATDLIKQAGQSKFNLKIKP